MHPLLQRQLKRLGLQTDHLPSNLVTWQQLLQQVSQIYDEIDRERSISLDRSPPQLENSQLRHSPTDLAAERNALVQLMSSLGAGLCMLDLSGVLVSMNREAEQLLGWCEAELLGQALFQQIAPGTQLAQCNFPDYFNQPQHHPSFQSNDSQFIQKNGKILPVSFVINPIKNDRELMGFLLIFFDVSEQKKAQFEAEQSLSLLQATFNATDAGILALDRQGKVCNFNQKFIEMWDIPNTLLESSPDQSVLTHVLRQLKNPPQFLQTIMQLSAEPQIPTYDIVEFIDRRIFEVYSHPSKVGGKSVGRVWSFRDITERKRVERALQYRVEFEDLITNLSTYFISLDTEEIDQGIEQALQKISVFLEVDRSYIYIFSDRERSMRSIYQWAAQSEYSMHDSINQNLSEDLVKLIGSRLDSALMQLYPNNIPWIFKQLNQLKNIYLYRDTMPDSAQADLRYLQKFHQQNYKRNNQNSDPLKNIQYLTIIPLICQKSLVGFLRFDLHSDYSWSGDRITLLKMVAEMFSNTIERKRTEVVLRRTETKYRSIFENAAEGIFQTTPEGSYLSANPALARILGYDSPADLIENVTDINTQLYVKPSRRAEFITTMNAEPSISGFESTVYRKDRRKIWISENVRVVKDVTGRIVCYEGTVEDITRSKKAAEELKQAKEAAIAANRAKSTFLANMSHELRTPLNAIIGYSEILAEESEDLGYSDLVPDLERIRSAGRNLLTLINDILDISKIEAGRMDLYIEMFSIPALIESVVNTAQPLIDKNRNHLAIDCQADLTCMSADVTKVRQVLLNLLSNAAKFTTEGQVTLTTRWYDRELSPPNHVPNSSPIEERFVQFQVRDHGIGMSIEQQKQLFQPFTQGDASTTRRYGGTGLGLTISQRFCQMMGGYITVKSEPNKGSTFTVVLPVEVKNLTSAPSEDPTHEPPETTVPESIQPPTVSPSSTLANQQSRAARTGIVLVIDDDPISRDLILRSLNVEPLQIKVASSGQEGLHLARVLQPDVITLDIMMPDMDGWSVLSLLKADPVLADIPVIVISFIGDESRGFALGASDYLTKPVDGKRLGSLLQKYHPHRYLGQAHTVREILVIEDEEITRQTLRQLLEHDGWQVTEAPNSTVALQQLNQYLPDLILMDLVLPERDGLELISQLKQHPLWHQIPIIVITTAELKPEERSQLTGYVEQVLQKGSYQPDELLLDIRELVNASLKQIPTDSLDVNSISVNTQL
ncbi:MAG: response regulator [Microcoleaceae cyanobacterium]